MTSNSCSCSARAIRAARRRSTSTPTARSITSWCRPAAAAFTASWTSTSTNSAASGASRCRSSTSHWCRSCWRANRRHHRRAARYVDQLDIFALPFDARGFTLYAGWHPRNQADRQLVAAGHAGRVGGTVESCKLRRTQSRSSISRGASRQNQSDDNRRTVYASAHPEVSNLTLPPPLLRRFRRQPTSLASPISVQRFLMRTLLNCEVDCIRYAPKSLCNKRKISG